MIKRIGRRYVNNYKAFSATLIGISHSKHGKECQDYSLHYPVSPETDDAVSLAVVADGHGSEDCFRSAKGAEFAALCAYYGIIEFIDTLNNWEIPQGEKEDEDIGFLEKLRLRFAKHTPSATVKTEQKIPTKEESEKMLRALVRHIIATWHSKVAEDYTKNPFQDTELANVEGKYKKRYEDGEGLHHAYGATLIAVAVTKDFWFGFHIGDGRFTALYKDGTFDQPVPWDERCYLNVTTSICDDDAAETARLYYATKEEKDLPLAVFLCSDGVDDNYPVDDNEQHLFKLYRTITQTFAEDGFESTCKQIADLANSFATKGKGDDTSIAGIIDMEAVKETAEIYKAQIAKEQGAAAQVPAEDTPVVEKTIVENPLPEKPEVKTKTYNEKRVEEAYGTRTGNKTNG
jgi:serine/threonine protein phosphatase PrpC